LLAAALAGGATVGCKSVDTGTIQIITDEDAGTFTQSPALTELQVAAESADASTVLATAQLPTTTIDLGQLSESTPAVLLGVTGFDSKKTARVFGETLPLQYAALAGQTIPIFVQRKGELALLPGPLSDSRPAPVLSVIQGEFLLVAGGGDPSLASTTQLFDFGSFAADSYPPKLPAVPESIALSGTVAWLINTKGATYFDFGSSAYGAVPAPSGGSFADVAGGATVIDSNGAQYIVGGTRTTGDPSATVLKIDPNDASDANYPYGKPSWIKLSTPRRGAGAAWIGTRGLVVAGGNTSSSAPGIEIVDPTFTETSALPFPADESVGVSAAPLDGQHVLLAGGITPSFQDPGSRAIDLACTPSASATGDASASTTGDASASTPCVTAWGSSPFALESAQTFAWTVSDAIVVGNEFATGRTHVFRLSPKSAVEVQTRVPHKNARAVWSPVGSIVLFGGAGALESFVP
jgi:hypothetical protein